MMDTISSLNALASKVKVKKTKKYQRLFLLTLNALSSLEKHAFFSHSPPPHEKKIRVFGISRYSGISNIRYFELISRSPTLLTMLQTRYVTCE